MNKFIVGNLKMNILTAAERKSYLKSIASETEKMKLQRSKVVLCPPFVHLESFNEELRKRGISIGVQNMLAQERGSFTGEISPLMIKNFGGEYVIIGHSERRRYFSETNESANEKIMLALKSGLRPIYCIGESEEERRKEKTLDVIVEQLGIGLAGISSAQIDKVIIAYEPIWAVGTDNVPDSNDIMQVKILIRKILSEMHGQEVAGKVPILYGGSVKAKSARQVCIDPAMDGALIGRESLVPVEFMKIADIIDKG